MPTTTNYGWTTPADTDLVKDGASAIRTLGSSIDTTTKALNPSTTLGDIEYRSSTANTNTRLPIGTTGQILSVSGGVPAWTTPAAGGGANWSLLNAGGTALTGAQTITISGISNVDKIMVLVSKASSASASKITVRLNGDTTATNYNKFGLGIDNQTTYAATQFYSIAGSITGEAWIEIGELGTAATTMTGYVLLSGCNSSGVKVFNSVGANSGVAGSKQYLYGGYYAGSSTISSVSMFSETGNFDTGTVFVYASA